MRYLWFGRGLVGTPVVGGVESFNHDNLLLARSRRARRGFPLIHFAAFVYLVLVLRIFAMAEVGPGSYGARVAALEQGGWVERATAILMAPDPLSQNLAVNLRRGFEWISGM